MNEAGILPLPPPSPTTRQEMREGGWQVLDHFELIRALYNRSMLDGYRAYVDPAHHTCWVNNELVNAWLNMICDKSGNFAPLRSHSSLV